MAKNQPAPRHMSPVPPSAYAQALLLIDSDSSWKEPLTKALHHRGFQFESSCFNSWLVGTKPRPLAFGSLDSGSWSVHMIVDYKGIPESSIKMLAYANDQSKTVEIAERHKLAVTVFLTRAPEEATGLDRMRELAKVIWSWLDIGGELALWPEGNQGTFRETLIGLEPENLTSEHCYLFMSNGPDTKVQDDRPWLRTFGLGQFGLPDLCTRLSEEQAKDEEVLTSLRMLFEVVPPPMIEAQGMLPWDKEYEVLGIRWKPVAADYRPEGLASRHGLQYFEQVTSS